MQCILNPQDRTVDVLSVGFQAHCLAHGYKSRHLP